MVNGAGHDYSNMCHVEYIEARNENMMKRMNERNHQKRLVVAKPILMFPEQKMVLNSIENLQRNSTRLVNALPLFNII